MDVFRFWTQFLDFYVVFFLWYQVRIFFDIFYFLFGHFAHNRQIIEILESQLQFLFFRFLKLSSFSDFNIEGFPVKLWPDHVSNSWHFDHLPSWPLPDHSLDELAVVAFFNIDTEVGEVRWPHSHELYLVGSKNRRIESLVIEYFTVARRRVQLCVRSPTHDGAMQ